MVWNMTGHLNTTSHVITFYTVQVGTTARQGEADAGKSHVKNQVWTPPVTLLSLSCFLKNGRNCENVSAENATQER